jgi:pyridoxal phosphate enzyme (YggS family)
MVHSLDSQRLAEIMNRQCIELGKRMPVLLEVNISGEESKGGFSPNELEKAIPEILKLENLSLRGLMTMAPLVRNPEETRPVFRDLRQLFEKLANNVTMPEWNDLSMGMTNDFEIAIEEGATLVRIGRAIF